FRRSSIEPETFSTFPTRRSSDLLTKLDVLDTFEEIRIATAYEIEGVQLEDFPDDLSLLERAKPIYETLPGWRCSTSDIRSVDELDRKSTRLNSSHVKISYAVFCL